MPQRWLARVVALLPAVAVLVLLVPFVAVDPPDGVTFSNSPFTDEAWWLANARNFALLGRWSTDDWNLHLVSPVYSAVQAGALMVGDGDMLAARLLVIGSVALTCLALSVGLARLLGPLPAVVAAAGYGLSILVLYYGRLAYVEPVVALWLTMGALLVTAAGGRSWPWGLAGGILLALAIGTKPTAIPLVAGGLAGLLIVEGWARRWAGAAMVVIVAGAIGWGLLVLAPQPEAVAAVGRILAEVTLPDDAGELLYRVLAYPISNDLALAYSLPLLIGAVAGVVMGWRRWSALDPSIRRLIAFAAGWAVAGLVLLMVIPYRPNRYFLPLLPALAMLTAVALAAWPSVAPSLGHRRRLGITAAAAVALVLPGLAMHMFLMANGTRELGPLQERVAAAVGTDSAVQGAYAPLWAFHAPAVAIVSRPESAVNDEDLYALRGVRWLVLEPGEVPHWAGRHAAQWASREELLCQAWGRVELCLVRVP